MCDLRIVLLPILFSLGIFPPSNQLNKMERRRIYGWNLWLAKKIKKIFILLITQQSVFILPTLSVIAHPHAFLVCFLRDVVSSPE